MAVYAALVSLINNIDQISNHPRLSNCFHDEQIQLLLQSAGSLLDFIEQGYSHGGFFTQQEAEDHLEREITCAAHAAEDVIESHVVDQIHGGTQCSLDLQQLIQDMGAVAGKAMELLKDKGGVREEEQQPITHPITPTPPHVGTTAMVGLDDELTQLLDSLTDYHSNRHLISIVGMGGTGKTTLALNLYENQLVKEHFHIQGWATVSQQFNANDILSQLLVSCQGKSTKGNVGELGDQLHQTLFGRRYLIILDDIWGVEAWDEVRRYLPDGDNRSRVVLTSRFSNITSIYGSACLDMNLLDEEKSWKLFCEKALFFPHKDDPLQLQLEDVAKKIVKSCKGLALSIVVIGGLLLKSPRTLEYWENVLKDLGKNDSKEKKEGLDALSSSYNHLPPHLKPCFLYLGTFEEDSRICASNITRLWVAEGFIKPKGARVLEEIAEDHLKDLSDRNLVLGLERRFTGKIKSFSIHDLLRDLCITVAHQQEFFHVRKYGKVQGTERRLVCAPYEGKTVVDDVARSIFGRNKFSQYFKHKLLRVFDASRSIHAEDVYGYNVNLRYLVHRQWSANVCFVWNLQTLIIEDRYWSRKFVAAPPEIWKMRQLRHLKCDEVYLPDPPPRSSGEDDRMEQLQTLKKAVNLRLSEEVREMVPNIKKLRLLYESEMQGYDDSFIECLRNLDRFHKLESLSLDICPSELPSLDPKLSSKLAFPLSLKKLSLSSCNLSWEDVLVIGSLPQLQVLHLKYHAVRGKGLWSPITGQFRSLKFMEILFCDLSCWDADNSYFPVLEKLVLRYLDDLEEIPMEIGEIPTLGLIRLDQCSESAAISAVKINKDQLENGNDAIQIEVVVNVADVESFKRRLEIEELHLIFLNSRLISSDQICLFSTIRIQRALTFRVLMVLYSHFIN